MRITIEALDIQEIEKIILFLKSLDIKNIEIVPGPANSGPAILKGDKNIDPRDLFGIWEKQPRDVESIRKDNWKR